MNNDLIEILNEFDDIYNNVIEYNGTEMYLVEKEQLDQLHMKFFQTLEKYDIIKKN